AESYHEEVFTRNTAFEIEFLMQEFMLPKGCSILDMGCGIGRHAVELAKHGYYVTGVDLTPAMLARARAAADAAGVVVEFINSNAADLRAIRAYDAAVCLCEGALCLLGSEDDPLERDMMILKNIHDALKPGGKFITTVINACRRIREISEEHLQRGAFDINTLTEICEMQIETPDGQQTLTVIERCYTPPEFMRMLKGIGFEVENVWGGTAGNWNRESLRLDEMEMMVVARKLP
ncbi:MAG: methyltransferase domain-containing protein, partial [Anaerolineaceae bacterium]|nr:methyltransferase domain-containing protein [Anaerolineaceae bacterium]